MTTRRLRFLKFSYFLIAALGSTGIANADEHEHKRTPLLPKYQQECSDCHVAYPPGLLPAASWKALMRDLPHHFGSDASLDAATAKEVADWLATNAGSGRRGGEAPPEHRITRSAWFLHEHDEVPASTWKLAAVKSAANCTACHTRADQNSYSEREIRLPRQ